MQRPRVDVLTAGLSVKHSRGTQCPCGLTSDTCFNQRKAVGTLFVNIFAMILGLKVTSSKTTWDSYAHPNFLHVFSHQERMVQGLHCGKNFLVDFSSDSEPGWSLLRETWSCWVTAWRPTLTSKVKTQRSITQATNARSLPEQEKTK